MEKYLTDNPRFAMRLYYALAVLTPMAILWGVFAAQGVFPFRTGEEANRMILVSDFWQQYYPFISDYWHRLRGGDSLLWSWTAGGGHNFLAHIAYYLASPFNLLAALFPYEMLRPLVQVFLVIKLGLAGAAMCAFLHYTTKKINLMTPFFATLYALCGFALAYYWNIMWMDSFALVPVVMIGVYQLVHTGRYRLFVVSLALAIIFNFLMGVFICIFVAIYFFMQAYIAKLKPMDFLMKLLAVGLCSLLAIGLTAFITLPTFVALDRSYNAVNSVNTMESIHEAWFTNIADVLGNFFAQHHHDLKHPPIALPSFFTGVISLMLLPVFLISDKINKREKIAFSVALAFLIISSNNRYLDFILHGFSFPHALPFRYAFIASFLLVALAYKAYLIFDTKKPGHTLALVLGGAFFALMATIGRQEGRYVGFGALFVLLYLILFMITGAAEPAVHKTHILFKAQRVLKGAVPILFAMILIFEVSIAAVAAVQSNTTTPREPYPWHNDEVQYLLAQRNMTDETDFFRTEFTRWWSSNDTTLYGYQGWALFSSMFDYTLGSYIQRLGLPYRRRSNSINYAETTPLTNAFLNMRYLVHRSGHQADTGVFWEQIAYEGSLNLMRNRYALPLGFMVRSQAAMFEGSITHPFASQNELFRLTTGLQQELFTLLPMTYNHINFTTYGNDAGTRDMARINPDSGGTLRFEFVVPRDGCLYGFIHYHGGTEARVLRNGEVINTVDITHSSYIFRMGSFNAGDIAVIESQTSAANTAVNVFAATIDHGLFAHGHTLLAAEPLVVTHMGDTRIEGTVTTQGGLLYTSIPHAGNWRVYVNGERAEAVLFADAMVAVELPAGTHDIVFRHVNSSFRVGVVISVVSLVVLIASGFALKLIGFGGAAAPSKRKK
ncbi:MAG: YfhO family protein [Defluviitaleaceae bacterium]|nr:YfhO family protein [Defluviitaleaceae bacterium]